MSTAFQTASHQPTSVSSPLLSPAIRHSAHPSPTRDNYAPQHSSGASSSSSQRPSRKASATEPQTAIDSSMSTRPAPASPVPVSAQEYPTSTSERRRHNMPAAVPPRGSSVQHLSTGSTTPRRATQAHDRPTGSPRRLVESARESMIGAGDIDELPSQSSRSRRSHAQTPQRVPLRETSEILNSVAVSSADEHVQREKDRLALAQTHHAAVDDSPSQADRDESRRGGRTRHDASSTKREKNTRFGEYILGNTIGEGEFGKVKLGWKPDSDVQVAIKLIKKDQLGSNPSRMAKIMREVAILKKLTHPNIVRLHKMEESERHYGIVLEYASGGELFDYILNNRYLKDNSARRLFAQLVSGVGYLHKKGIVHRDLKLENLLLDRNRNIIITDFGFANTFDPHEDLTEDEELRLGDKAWVKDVGLDVIKADGHRKGDLMQTSCGSPCYAAPELVVSDSLYTGRKVDVWSCGVILYAMLAGYLPFDDDPANPEGDNINLLYKYIVNTPLTFPEYVSPHARDLLRRILVANPRKRADLFEVARHSWLSEYAHVVEFITSNTTTAGEIQNTTVPAEDVPEAATMARSASVREASKKSPALPSVGGLTSKQGTVDAEADSKAKAQRDNKRRTVQVEYVAPSTTTQRGESSGTQPGKTRVRSGSQGPVEVTASAIPPGKDKAPQRDASVSMDPYNKTTTVPRRPPSTHQNTTTVARLSREIRPGSSTQQSVGSRGQMGRTSYGQPVPPELADTNVHGRIQQPPKNSGKSTGHEQQQKADYRSSLHVPSKFADVSGFSEEGADSNSGPDARSHKRSSTASSLGSMLRSSSLFGSKSRKHASQTPAAEKGKKYPPISMNNAMPSGDEPRPSMDSRPSRRSFSIGLRKKRSGSVDSRDKSSRRFSFIPTSFSFRTGAAASSREDLGTRVDDPQQHLPIQEPPQLDQYGRYVDQNTPVEARAVDAMYQQLLEQQARMDPSYQAQQRQQQFYDNAYRPRPPTMPAYSTGTMLHDESESPATIDDGPHPLGSAPIRPAPVYAVDDARRANNTGRVTTSPPDGRSMLQKNNRRFVDAWNGDDYAHGSSANDHSGSSGPARKVMDFFRRRGKARAGES